MASTTCTIVLPEPMPMNFALGSKWSATARMAAFRFADSMSAILEVERERREERCEGKAWKRGYEVEKER